MRWEKKKEISGPPHSSIQWVIPSHLLLVTGGRLCTCVPRVFLFLSPRSSECLFISLWPGEEWAVKDSEPLIPEITRGMRAGRPPVCRGLIKENTCDGGCIPLTAVSQTLKIPCFVNQAIKGSSREPPCLSVLPHPSGPVSYWLHGIISLNSNNKRRIKND